MNTKSTCKVLALTAAGLFVLVGCGGSNGGEETGALNISLTDGPVHDAEAVVIEFTGLELKPAGGPPEFFELNSESCDEYDTSGNCSIDLLMNSKVYFNYLRTKAENQS